MEKKFIIKDIVSGMYYAGCDLGECYFDDISEGKIFNSYDGAESCIVEKASAYSKFWKSVGGKIDRILEIIPIFVKA